MNRYTTRVFTFLLAACSLAGEERWMETRIAGQPAGYLHENTETGAHIVTSAESHTVLNRLGSKLEITGKTRFEETEEGRLLAVSAEISSSAQSTLIDGRVDGERLILRISTGGKSYDRSISLSEPLTGPEGARRLTMIHLLAPGNQVAYSVFSPELGAVSRITRTCTSRSAAGFEIEEEATGLPGKASPSLDSEARLRRRVDASPVGDIEVRLATKEVALAASGNGAELREESFQKSLVRSNIRLPHERSIDRLRVRIRHKKPELGWPEFTGEHQAVLSKSASEVVLEIRRDGKAGVPAPPSPYLAANALFQSDDPAIVAIARQVSGDRHDVFALREWTSRNVRFDPGIAIAPASEVARNRAGTCFGYSILLGSLARAAGIPSRMKMGLAYVGGVWGGHAWIEVFQAGEWIPVDAALPSDGRADAARISFFSSSLEEGTLVGMGDLARIFGNVEIDILDYTIHDETIHVPSGAPPYRIEGDRYENPWLRLKLQKPAGYRFAKLDAVWPETAILALDGPSGERVTLSKIATEPDEFLAKVGIHGGTRQEIRFGGRAGFETVTGSKAVMLLPGDHESWAVVVEAPSAASLLKQIQAKLTIDGATATAGAVASYSR